MKQEDRAPALDRQAMEHEPQAVLADRQPERIGLPFPAGIGSSLESISVGSCDDISEEVLHQIGTSEDRSSATSPA